MKHPILSLLKKTTLRKVGEVKSDSFTVDLVWTAAGKTHLTEARTYAFRKIDDRTTLIDFTSKLTAADGDATFGDTKEDFFSIRVDRTLRQKGATAKGAITDSDFEQRKDKQRAGVHVLKQGETLVFRYAVLIHHGSIGTANIQDRWKQFSSQS